MHAAGGKVMVGLSSAGGAAGQLQPARKLLCSATPNHPSATAWPQCVPCITLPETRSPTFRLGIRLLLRAFVGGGGRRLFNVWHSTVMVCDIG